MLNTHGLKVDMESLKQAQEYTNYIPRGYVQISYDMEDGEFLYNYHYDTESWTRYHSDSILTVMRTARRVSKQEILDDTSWTVRLHKEWCEECERFQKMFENE